MRMKLFPVLILAGASLALFQCEMGGGGGDEEGGTQDAIVGVWALSSITDKNAVTQTPAAAGFDEQAVFWGNGGFVAGMESSSSTWGGSFAGCGVGSWTPAGSGSYAYTTYSSMSSGTATTGTLTLGGGTLTASGVNPGDLNGPYTLTFIKSSAAPASSDPLIGTWELTAVESPTYGVQTPLQSGCAEIVICLGDGSYLMGLQLGPDWGNSVGCGVGTWTSVGSGTYNSTAYATWASTAWAGTMTLSGSTLTGSNIPGPGGSSTFTLAKSVVAVSSSDPLIGTWTVTSVTPPSSAPQTPAVAGLYETVVFQSDGSFLAGMQMGGSGTTWGGTSATYCAVGTWVPGTAGSYTATAYPSFGTTASTNTMTLSGGIMSASIPSGPGGSWTMTFTKQ